MNRIKRFNLPICLCNSHDSGISAVSSESCIRNLFMDCWPYLQGMDVQGKYLKMAMLFFNDDQAEAVVGWLSEGGCQTAGKIPHFLNFQDRRSSLGKGSQSKLNSISEVLYIFVLWFCDFYFSS